jgi:hypothetical protein
LFIFERLKKIKIPQILLCYQKCKYNVQIKPSIAIKVANCYIIISRQNKGAGGAHYDISYQPSVPDAPRYEQYREDHFCSGAIASWEDFCKGDKRLNQQGQKPLQPA